MTVIPLLLVNAVAVTGQLIFWKNHLPWPILAIVMFALALESVAIYLAYHAHLATVNNDSATRLRMSSYAFGIVVGLVNGSHFLVNGQITAAAIGMGLMSASSPFLWAIHSRRQSRDKLMENGEIEPHALRLGITRWTWHPGKSARVMSAATWTGERIPAAAIATYEAGKAARKAQEERQEIDPAASQASNVRIALRENPDTATAPEIAAWLAERGVTVTPAYVRALRSAQGRQEVADRRQTVHALPPAENSG